MSKWMKNNFSYGMMLSLLLALAGSLSTPAYAQFRYVGPSPGVVAQIPPPPPPPLQAGDYLCDYGAGYNIVWDGLSGVLVLLPPGYPDYQPKGVLVFGQTQFPLRYQIITDPQDVIDGHQGPGFRGTNSSVKHRIVFWVDFRNTPSVASDDQRFDGYMMTKTKNAMAGVTWMSNVPYGFYANNKQCIVG